MAAWLTVYCARSVATVTARKLLAFLRDLDDPYTLAEGFGIDDQAAVDQALARLRVEPATRPAGVRFRLRYRPAPFRPVLVHLWDDPERVAAEREEALEQLGRKKGPGAARVRAHLARVTAVVAVELGLGQLEDMGLVLAGQVAEYFASAGDGVIRDQNEDWWAVRNGVPMLVVGRRRRT